MEFLKLKEKVLCNENSPIPKRAGKFRRVLKFKWQVTNALIALGCTYTKRFSAVAGIFTVMCYNVLCDKYATRQMYGYCPSWALDWEYRKKGILDEIRHYAADIISLQEVETDQFYNFFLPELKQDGYDGIFSPKSRAKTMAENDRKYVDGCAIFYRTAK